MLEYAASDVVVLDSFAPDAFLLSDAIIILSEVCIYRMFSPVKLMGDTLAPAFVVSVESTEIIFSLRMKCHVYLDLIDDIH